MGYMHRESSLSDNILVVDLGGQTLARTTGIIWWEKGLLLLQSNKVRENFILCQVSDACLMISVSKCLTADMGTCMCLLLSAVLFWIGENEHRLQFLRAGLNGTTMQSSMLTAPNLAVSCWRWSRCGASGAEQEFNEFLLFVSVAKDLQILTLPWSCLIPCLNSTEILKGKSALVLFSGNSSASQ